MKAFRLFRDVRVPAFALAVCALGIGPRSGAAQAAALVGTWEFNAAKSAYSPGPPPKSNTLTYTMAGKSLKLSAKGVNGAGNPTAVSWTGQMDGKDVAVTGSPDYDAVAFTRVSATAFDGARKKGGKTVQTAHYVISNGGKTLTIKATGTNAAGVPISNTTVFNKK